MKYIYDILLNFNELKLYEFYEWNENDDIEYFKRVPLIKTDNITYKNLDIGNIIDDSLFLDKIRNNTELYDNKMIRRIEYACIVTEEDKASGVLINKNGQIVMMSKMLLDEENEAIEIGNTLKELPIKVITKDKTREVGNSYLTRREIYKANFLNKEIDGLYQTKNIIKLKYLYFECFNLIEDNIDLIFNEFKSFLSSEWNGKHNSLYDLVRLSYSKK